MVTDLRPSFRRAVFLAAFLSAVEAGTPTANALSLAASAGGGGGFDSNLNHVAVPEAAESAFYWHASVRASLGRAFGRSWLQLGARYAFSDYPAFPDLSVHRASAALGLSRVLRNRHIIGIVPIIGFRSYGEETRTALDVGASLSARLHLTDRLALRPAYGFTWSNSATDVYDEQSHRIAVGLSSLPWRGAILDLDYGLEFGQVIRYEEVTQSSGQKESRTTAAVLASSFEQGDGPGDGGDGQGQLGTPTNVFGTDTIAYSTAAITHRVTVDLEQTLTPWLLVRASTSYGYVSADPEPFSLFSAALSFGLRLP